MSDALLLATAPDARGDAFGEFYERHLAMVLAFVLRRVQGDREVAADVTAETFARALAARSRFDPERGEARAWLCTIAIRVVTDSVRKGRVDDRTRRRLKLEPVEFYDDDLARVDALAMRGGADAERAEELLLNVEPKSRVLVRERIVHDRPYTEIADEVGMSESVVRKRVSRGLAQIRSALETT